MPVNPFAFLKLWAEIAGIALLAVVFLLVFFWNREPKQRRKQ